MFHDNRPVKIPSFFPSFIHLFIHSLIFYFKYKPRCLITSKLINNARLDWPRNRYCDCPSENNDLAAHNFCFPRTKLLSSAVARLLSTSRQLSLLLRLLNSVNANADAPPIINRNRRTVAEQGGEGAAISLANVFLLHQ